MSSLAIPIIFLIVSLIIDKAKDNKKNNKETVKKVKQKKKIPKQVYKGYNQRDNHIPKHESSQQQFFERKPRVIVDKEKISYLKFWKTKNYVKQNMKKSEVML